MRPPLAVCARCWPLALLLLPACEPEAVQPLEVNFVTPKDDVDVQSITSYQVQLDYSGGSNNGLVFEYTLTPGQAGSDLLSGLTPTTGDGTIHLEVTGLVPGPNGDEPRYKASSGRFPLDPAVMPSITLFLGRVDAFNVLDQTLGTTRTWHTSTALRDGTVLIAGGTDDDGAGLSSAELFDNGDVSQQFGITDNALAMDTARVNHAAALIDTPSGSSAADAGKVLLTGGDSGPRLSFHLADLTDNAGVPYQLTLPVVDVDSEGITTSSSSQLFDPASGSFEHAAAMPEARSFHQAGSLPDGSILLCGGLELSPTAALAPTAVPSISSTCRTYAKGSFSEAPLAMNEPRLFHQLTRLSDGAYLITGGLDNTDITKASFKGKADRYQPGGTSLSDAGSMLINRAAHSAVLLSSGEVLLTGGLGLVADKPQGGQPSGKPTYTLQLLSSAELFDPAATGKSFKSAGIMNFPRAFHTSIALPNKTVLILGGIGYTLDQALPSELYSPDTGTFTVLGQEGVAAVFGNAFSLLSKMGGILFSGGQRYNTEGTTAFGNDLRMYLPAQ